MKAKLLKNIVIPAGTVFTPASQTTKRYGEGHVEHTIGLTNDSSGDLTYLIDPTDEKLGEWFEKVEE